jgi:hypothetical protein
MPTTSETISFLLKEKKKGGCVEDLLSNDAMPIRLMKGA